MKQEKIQKHLFKLGFLGMVLLTLILTAFSVKDRAFYGVNVKAALTPLKWISLSVLGGMLIISVVRIIQLKKTRKGLYTLFVLLALITMVLNAFIPTFAMAINRFIGVGNYDKALAQSAKEVGRNITEKIQEEGVVLLENKNNTLPLSLGKVNVFGYVSNSVIYGGTGSGGGKPDNNITLYQGLENAGFEVNQELQAFYEARFVPRETVDIHKLVGGDYNVHEPAQSEYTPSLIENAKAHSDKAIIMFGRNAGEGADMAADMALYEGGSQGQHYLELTQNERDLLDMVKDEFEHVVVLINSPNQMELGFLEDEGVDAALWIGYPGSTGFNGVSKVLSGEVNPSGRLVDTYAYDLRSAPSFYNTGEFAYTNVNLEYGKNIWHHKYINYAEGIYIGYKYYETRFVDNQSGLIDEEAYQALVQYPFGYGLSYTEFNQEIVDFTEDEAMIKLSVKVTNTGNVKGKDVVQVYHTAPYTIGGIEKAHVVLSAFGKTSLLEPNESEIITLQINVEDLASYDYKTHKAYVLEAGDYEIKLMRNAHDVIDTKTYTVSNTHIYQQRSTDQIPATNQFDDIYGEDVVYLSRNDWENTFPKEMAQDKEASQSLIDALNAPEYEVDESAQAIIFAKHNLTLKDVAGLPFEDPKWDLLLQQLSIKEMHELISSGGFQTANIKSIKKPATIDTDGPTGVNDIFSGLAGNQYTSQVVLASTWNLDLAYEMGQAVANEATAMHMSGLYMPGVNLHRTALGGRNFEYYSEDPLLSGHMGGSTAQGVADNGAFVYIKHFAMYDMETKRYEYPTGAIVWSQEQAMRENYLKAFEVAIKNYNVTGVMSSYNRVGPTWVGASSALLNTVLREEWGFRGAVISDFYKPQYMNGDASLVGGNDLILFPITTSLSDDTLKTNWGHQNMRRASHNILYPIANSGAYENVNKAFPTWITIFIAVDLLAIGGLTKGLLWSTNSVRRKKKKA